MKVIKSRPIKLLAAGLSLIALLYTAGGCVAQPTPARALLALSKGDHVLAIIDPVSLKVVAKVPVGSDPHEVIASADGKTAYVTIYGGGSLHELDVIDLVAQKALPAIDTKPMMGPHGITFVDGRVWFTAEGTKTVGRYDPATGKFDWVMGTGQDRTHMIYVTIDLATKKLTGKIDAKALGANRLKFTPDGKRVLITSLRTGDLFICDAVSRREIKRINTGRGAAGILVDDDGSRAFIGCTADNYVAVIDLKTLTVTGHIDVRGADGLAWAVRP